MRFYNDHVTSLYRNHTKNHHDVVKPSMVSHINLSTNPDNLSSEDESD